MAFREYKVLWRRAGDTAFQEVTNLVKVNPIRQLDAEKNSCELILNYQQEDVVEDGEVKYQADDIIKVYAAEGNVTTTGSTDLIGTYIVQDYDITPDSRQLKLSLADKTYIMLSQIIVIPSGTKKVDEHVESIVQIANEDGTTTTPITTNIASTDSEGNAFPEIDFSTVYKTAYEAIAELSQPQNTGDNRAYVFYYDEDDNFFWEYRGQTPEATNFTYGEDPVLTMKIQRRESDAISMIIYDAGEDKNDNSRVFFYVDNNATTLNKSRIRYFPMIDISRDLRDYLEKQGLYAGTSNDDYVAALDAIAQARCQEIMDKIGKGLWEATIDIKGVKYTPGKLYPVKATDFGFPETNLRLEKVAHTMDDKGWMTKLTLAEDPESLE